MGFVELNGDQIRETINTRQRDQAWRGAVERERGYRESMVWRRRRDRTICFRPIR